MRISNDVSGVTRLQLRVMQTSLDEASITSYALCMLSIEWIKRQMEGENQSFEDLQEKVGQNLLASPLPNPLPPFPRPVIATLSACCPLSGSSAKWRGRISHSRTYKRR